MILHRRNRMCVTGKVACYCIGMHDAGMRACHKAGMLRGDKTQLAGVAFCDYISNNVAATVAVTPTNMNEL